MSLFSWFNSADQIDAALVVVAITGSIIEVGVAVAAVINVHKELEESRKEKLEKYIEVFACVAAFFFLAEAILGCRSSVLLGIELEKLKTDNLKMEARLQPRIITIEKERKFILLCKDIPKMPIKIFVGVPDNETEVFADQVRQMLDDAGFGGPDAGIVRDSTLYMFSPIGMHEFSPIDLMKNDTNMVAEMDAVAIPNTPREATVSLLGSNFGAIGFKATWFSSDAGKYLNEGDAAIFIPPKALVNE